MRSNRKVRPTALVALVAVLVTALAGGGFALAQGPAIHACANRHTGALRLSPPPCSHHETAVVWNVQGPRGPQGSQGPQGPQGPPGQNGTATSANSLNGVTIVRSAETANPPNSSTPGEAACPSGTNVIGGGAKALSTGIGSPSNIDQTVGTSWPARSSDTSSQPDAWFVYMSNPTSSTLYFYVYAVCAPVSMTSNYTGAF
jgi:hypothetical protein